MNYAESVKRHADAHPFIVERWSSVTQRWLHVADHKSRESADRRIAGYRVYPAYALDTFRIINGESIEVIPA